MLDRTAAEADSSADGRMSIYCVLVCAVLLAGCNRAFYREQADADAYSLIRQKTCNPRWPLEDYTIDVDPLSRMYDPFDPDYPPLPPDDPTAHALMHCIDCKKGYPCWHANGDTNQVENPHWVDSLPIDEDGAVILDADSAMFLARLHSTDYQRQLEELYLSALDVSFERFRFDTQFFAGTDTLFTARDNFSGPDSSILDVNQGLRANKLFSTGGELVVGLANSLMWQFSGPNNFSLQLLDFSLVQPLLRGGGRDRVLERLTIAERTLLANVRQMERFRRGFYLEVITGRDAGQGPNRRGGVFGGAGLEGFTGSGGGGFGTLGGGNFTGTGIGFETGAGAERAGGFLGLLQDQQDIVNQRGNIAALQSSVIQLEEYFLSGRIDFFQVELARQALYNAQSVLLNSELAYQQSLDDYKRTLDVRQYIEFKVNDELIEPFQLVDMAIVPIQNRLTALQQAIGRDIIRLLGEAATTVADNDNADTQADIEWNVDVEKALQSLRKYLTEARDICDHVLNENVPRARKDLVRLNQSLPQRLRDMSLLKVRFEQRLDVTNSTSTLIADGDGQRYDSPIPLETDRLQKLPTTLNATLNELETRFRKMLTQLEAFDQEITELATVGEQLSDEQLTERISKRLVERIPSQLSDLAADVLGLTLVQARARTESVSLIPVELDWQDALEIARCNRRDWMNARASLVDSWRLVQFNADDLESQLDFVLAGDLTYDGNNALDLRDTNGRISVGVAFDAPISRLAERNIYRQALIEYRQAQRRYYTFIDRITAGLRDTIRNLDMNQLNFELRRAAIEVAISQVELARLRLQEPPKPNEEAVLGATTARDLVTALTDLLTAQNDFLSVWINQEALRRTLDYDMGTMQLDFSDNWIDPGPLVANDPRVTLGAMENALEAVPLENVPALIPNQNEAFDDGLLDQGYMPVTGGIQPVSFHKPLPNVISGVPPRRLPPTD